MPADTIGNSISSFLNKTDQVSQKYRNVQLESDAGDRFGRSSSVARATSVARQFEPTSSTFMRAGSVARGFETSSRDPFYSQISKPPSVTRQAQTMLSPHSSVLETINQSHLLSPSQSKNVIRENKNGNAKFRSLEDECNWILSGRDPLPDDIQEEDENTLDDISGDEFSEITMDHDDGPALPQSDGTPSGEQQVVKPKRREKKKSDMKPLMTSPRFDSLNSSSSRYQTNGFTHNNTYFPEDEDEGMYRLKYERTKSDLENAKRRLVEQHEEDLEQTMMMKKQMEKKIIEATEEVEESKRDSAQWKNKYKKVQVEMDETRIMLEEQNEKNGLLERKFRKVDSELMEIQQEILREANIRSLLEKDMDVLRHEKARLTDDLHALKSEFDMKEHKIKSLMRELEDLKNDQTMEEENRKFKKQKMDLENRLKEQVDELDELSSQIQMLESSKTKLEMTMQQIQHEHRRQLEQKEEEIEDVKHAFGKKLKVLEQQLEQEHEDRIEFLREKHDLESRIATLQDMLEVSAEQEGLVMKLKKDLKRAKALLRDAHCVAENSQTDGTNTIIMKQLKQQLEEAEQSRAAAVKIKQNKEKELSDLQQQLDEVSRMRKFSEEKCSKLGKEKSELVNQLDENEEELQEVIRKYKTSVNTISQDQLTIQKQTSQIQELELGSKKLKEQLTELSRKLEDMNQGSEENSEKTTADVQKLELRVKDLETKLELEKTTKGRMESHIKRQTDVIECLQRDLEEVATKEKNGQEEQKKLKVSIRTLKEELSNIQNKEKETILKKSEAEKQLEVVEAEKIAVKNQLKLAQTRIEGLQSALKSGDSDDEEEITTFLDHHRRAMSVQRERSLTREVSMGRELRATSMSRDHRASVSREPRPGAVRDIRSMSREIRASVAREFEAVTRDFLSTREDTKEPVTVTQQNVTKEKTFESIAEVD